MDRAKGIVGVSRYDRASLPMVPIAAFPTFPNAGESERQTVFELNVERLFGSFSVALPFVKAVGRYEATAAFEGRAERGFLGNRLASGIYHPVRGDRVIPPGWP